jgi:hypothetical protein
MRHLTIVTVINMAEYCSIDGAKDSKIPAMISIIYNAQFQF